MCSSCSLICVKSELFNLSVLKSALYGGPVTETQQELLSVLIAI